MAILTSKNTLPVTLGVALYNLKQFLKTAGWTVVGSGDGLSAYSSSSDIITTGASGAGGMANAKAWFQVQMPSTTRQFTFQWVSSVAVRAKYTPAGFSSGGSSTATPTTSSASNEMIILGAGTDAAPTGWDLLGTINRVSYWADNASPYGWGMLGWSAAGATTFGLMLEAMLSGTYPVADTDPYIVVAYPSSGSGTAGSEFGINGTTQSGNYPGNYPQYAFTLYGQASQAIQSYGGMILMSGTAGQGPIPYSATLGANPWTTKDDNFPIVWCRLAGYYKGVGKYALSVGTTRANLSCQTASTTADRVIIGNWSLPWGTDGVVPLL